MDPPYLSSFAKAFNITNEEFLSKLEKLNNPIILHRGEVYKEFKFNSTINLNIPKNSEILCNRLWNPHTVFSTLSTLH